MGIKTYSIDDELYKAFTKAHKGDMSKLISRFITEYLQYDAENSSAEITKLDQRIEETNEKIDKLKIEKTQLILQKERIKEAALLEKQQKKKEKDATTAWLKDVKADMKHNGTLLEHELAATKLDMSIDEYLLAGKHIEGKEDEN